MRITSFVYRTVRISHPCIHTRQTKRNEILAVRFVAVVSPPTNIPD